LAAAVAITGGAFSCSSGSQETGVACDTVYKGKCGITCKTDDTCDQGLYCGGQGVCTADCAPQHNCNSGFECSPTGRCVSTEGILGGAGGSGSPGSVVDPNNACVTDTKRGEGLPADLYIMNDQSLSMACNIPSGGNRWDAMTKALTGFLNSPDAAGLGVGLQYFGLTQGVGPFGQARGAGSCNPADYRSANVEIAPLPGNAQPLIRSLGQHGPTSYTPTPAALAGALDHAKQWAAANPSHLVSVVLATDGEPNLLMQGNQCAEAGQNRQMIQQFIAQVAQTAGAAFNGTPKVSTYVIGIVGGAGQCQSDPAPPARADLDQVAQAGGTGTSFIVDAATGDTSAQFLDALNRIRGAAVIPCQYVVPLTTTDGKTVDPNKVNITLTPGGGTAKQLLQASGANACDPANGGWYYTDQAKSLIKLCPASCNIVTADAQAQVDVVLGCVTAVGPIQ
jgi:hypothetical protein